MDIQAISVAAVGALLPYFVKMGEKAAEKVGEKLPDKISELYKAIKKKFKGDAYAKEALKRVKNKPESQARVNNLAEILAEKLADDQALAAQLEKLMDEIEPMPASQTTIKQNITISGKSGDVFQVGQVEGKHIKIGKEKS